MARHIQLLLLRRYRAITWLALIALLILITAQAWLPALGWWLSMPATVELHRSDVISVHGSNPLRRTQGIDLYRHSLAPELWMTGYDYMQAHIIDMVVNTGGVTSENFHYLATTSTWSDGTAIAALIHTRRLHRVIIVTEWWHSRRALCATRQQLQGYDVEIEFAPAPAAFGPDNWWQDAETRKHVLSEWGKLGYYALRYGMNPGGC